ncbi:hypothetical protein GQ44DRAFT_823479 [Phaeosphaeriaceae sp. PMI808]|nr:hypothetical protein GQ44DRAFT_823479 [Phaeosphaeriaceae sp. PMI808]
MAMDDEDDVVQSKIHHSPPASLKSLPPNINPLAAHPIASDERDVNFLLHKFSHPFWEQLTPFQFENHAPPPSAAPPNPHRSVTRLRSYRSNSRFIPHLRRQLSLETIDSVTTTRSIASDDDESDPTESTASSPFEDDLTTTPVPSNERPLALSVYFSSESSQPTPKGDAASVTHGVSDPCSPKALPRKLKHHKPNGSRGSPNHLIMESKVSFHGTSNHSELSSSNPLLPMEQPFVSKPFDIEQNQAKSRAGWHASSFDTTSLNEAEIVKCKTKGINPALYAEVKAAKKGNWISPITENTIV